MDLPELPDDRRECCCRRNLPSEERALRLLWQTIAVFEQVLDDYGDPDPGEDYMADDYRGLLWNLRLAESVLTSGLLHVDDIHPTNHFAPSEN